MAFDIKKLPTYILHDLQGKDETPPFTPEEGMKYRWIIIGLCVVGAMVTSFSIVGPIIFGLVAVRKLWINLHKMGYIPFG